MTLKSELHTGLHRLRTPMRQLADALRANTASVHETDHYWFGDLFRKAVPPAASARKGQTPCARNCLIGEHHDL